ncbi:hypothetical protein Y1Q_0021360 [Alligator mississippiensis]|uniref:Uncharacterized protein n=1 Tax=Alligator mississippiensis TaxID=8496 RepID=A0A151P9B3_ALLMI|nr:hypothetical protein Y1Q_0021360 [Alligator mississippiensis]
MAGQCLGQANLEGEHPTGIVSGIPCTPKRRIPVNLIKRGFRAKSAASLPDHKGWDMMIFICHTGPHTITQFLSLPSAGLPSAFRWTSGDQGP